MTKKKGDGNAAMFLNGGGYRGICSALIHLAVHQARSRHDVDAIVWLGSSSARPWFDRVDLDQERCLRWIGWLGLARHALDKLVEQVGPARMDYVFVLEDGIAHFEKPS